MKDALRTIVVAISVAWVACSGRAQCPTAEIAALQGPDVVDNQNFGAGVAVDGEIAIIGAPRDRGQGAAYVYRYQDGEWDFETKLTASDADGGERFGGSVAIDGDVVIIGASTDSVGAPLSGSAYVFRLSEGSWIEESKLTGSDPGEGDAFGTVVSISGDAVLIGARGPEDDAGLVSGRAYVFRYTDGNWVEEQELLASAPQSIDAFGSSVALSANVALVGAMHASGGPQFSGVVYIYRFDGEQWSEEVRLMPSDPQSFGWFGRAVAVDGDLAVMGALGGDAGPGHAYIFRFDPDAMAWVQEVRLTASDEASRDRFGSAVDIVGDTALISSPKDDDNGADSGSAYTFWLDGGSWREVGKLTASNGTAGDSFGEAVALDADTIIVGAKRHANTVGGAYIYAHAPCGCSSDLDGDGNVGFSDLLAILSAWGPYDPCPPYVPEDIDRNCDVGFSDLLVVLSAWGPCFPFGACCLPDGRICMELSQFTCIAQGGVFQGVATTCEDACPLGACCFPDNRLCVDVSELACISSGGVYQGVGTTCDEACPPGACCFADGTCTQLAEFGCGAQGGTYLGEGVACEGAFCGDACRNALPVGEGSFPYSTDGATEEGPDLPETCDEGNGLLFRKDIWFRYTASCDGVATASVCESSFDTRLAIYEDGDCPGAFLACNDDACGTAGTRSAVSFPVVSGGAYLIRIGARFATGGGRLIIECAE